MLILNASQKYNSLILLLNIFAALAQSSHAVRCLRKLITTPLLMWP
jgi:hypothetical protein